MTTKTDVVREGYCVVTPTLCQGDVLAWSESESGEEDDTVPLVFNSLHELRVEQLGILEEHIRQFKDGDRDWDEIDFDTDEYPAWYQQYVDGRIVVLADKGSDQVILETTLDEWRKNR